MDRIVTGIVAHVDSGKTTLSEAMLYTCGAIKKQGRVDHKDTLLDTFEQERARGITIFSKQAYFTMENKMITLLDTPGHVDFAGEMERALMVLDYAILVISGADGVQGHTRTLWKLLNKYKVPVFIFVNKMDQPKAQKDKLIKELKNELNAHVVCMDGYDSGDEECLENIAMCDDELIEKYLAGNLKIEDDKISELVSQRKLFPCFFGSALKLTGVETFMAAFVRFTRQEKHTEEFGARVYKIAKDEQGNRLTYLKITSGKLKVRDVITNKNKENDIEEIWEEKVNQIRLYQGAKYENLNEANAGMVCAITGLSNTFAGEGLGIETGINLPVLAPIMQYRLEFDSTINKQKLYLQVKQLEEEDPLLDISWNDKNQEILVKLMGEVQTEILTDIIKKRFDVDVTFGQGTITYKETITDSAIGVGHFEPLRHYAEVHVLLEPGPVDSGIQIECNCSEEKLAKNWQRLIATHLGEKEHLGVLCGFPITDIKITVINGRAHLKHTEGGDFRNATYRAVRNGLMKAKSQMLEPYYSFNLQVPREFVGRAMTDLEARGATFETPQIGEDEAIIVGRAPVVLLRGYQREVNAYTSGLGSIYLEFGGYRKCHNEEEVIENIGYNPELDVANPTGSVFCAHGAGFYVLWDEVEEYMHVEDEKYMSPSKTFENNETIRHYSQTGMSSQLERRYSNISYSDDKELQDIFRRTYGETKRKRDSAVNYDYSNRQGGKGADLGKYKPSKPKEMYMLVDGYNVIHGNEALHELADTSLEAARNVLMDVLSNYQGFRSYKVIVVFDAYKVKGNPGEITSYHNIDVVYTKEAETADRYIERTSHELSKNYTVTVVTSDGAEQVIIRGAGCLLMSSKEFWEDVELMNGEIEKELSGNRHLRYEGRNYLFNFLDDTTYEYLEKIRLGLDE